MRSITLHREWRQYAKFKQGHYTRNLIGFDEKFTILLLCWERGQMSPIHDHAGSNCWVKVLEGELQETVYDINADGQTVSERSVVTYHPPGVTYICGACEGANAASTVTVVPAY